MPRRRALLLGLATTLALTASPSAQAADVAGAAPDRPSALAEVDPVLLGRAGRLDVVVQASSADALPAVAAAVRRHGGTVGRSLPIVHGMSAEIPATALADLARTDGVRVVSEDRPVTVASSAASTTSGGGSRVGTVYPEVVNADLMHRRGLTGRGVTVAVVDTGVSEVEDLEGRIVSVASGLLDERREPCVDLSGEGTCQDTYGHGTFMAGLIAGDGRSSDGHHAGVAPEASILSVKVAGRSGATDVSTVLAAIQWVVSFREEYGIEVLNLSLGTDSQQSWRTDPLNYAVERAWAAGITVVVSAANLGPAPSTITKPADDPWVVTVGATDDLGTRTLGDDLVPDFSSRGPTLEGVAKPDVVAPGAHLLSLRAPGSHIDETFPDSRVGAYRKGSGTSMSAAVVSGTVALVLQARPWLSPDQVEHLLVHTARPAASDDPSDVGAGVVDARAAVTPASGRANVGLDRSSGTGDLDASRGTLRVQTTGLVETVLTGRQTTQLLLWDPVGFLTGDWSASTWYTSVHATVGWNPVIWAGHNWGGHNWGGHNWGGHNWGGHNWGGASWYGQDHPDHHYGEPTQGSFLYGAWD